MFIENCSVQWALLTVSLSASVSKLLKFLEMPEGLSYCPVIIVNISWSFWRSRRVSSNYCYNSVSNDKMLDWSKLKVFADDNY